MTSSGESNSARRILIDIVERHGNMTPALAIELARMLAHIAGGDGRGVYRIDHDPEGDRLHLRDALRRILAAAAAGELDTVAKVAQEALDGE